MDFHPRLAFAYLPKVFRLSKGFLLTKRLASAFTGVYQISLDPPWTRWVSDGEKPHFKVASPLLRTP